MTAMPTYTDAEVEAFRDRMRAEASEGCEPGRGPVTLKAVERRLGLVISLTQVGAFDWAEPRPPSPWPTVAPAFAKEPVQCANPACRYQTLWLVQQHHHPALAWRREMLKADPDTDTSWWTLSGWCGTDHDHYHTLLNMYVRAAAAGREAADAAESAGWVVNRAGLEAVEPPWSVRRTFGLFVRDNVAEAWRRRPPVTPYT